jgi:hypothetical protein
MRECPEMQEGGLGRNKVQRPRMIHFRKFHEYSNIRDIPSLRAQRWRARHKFLDGRIAPGKKVRTEPVGVHSAKFQRRWLTPKGDRLDNANDRNHNIIRQSGCSIRSGWISSMQSSQ